MRLLKKQNRTLQDHSGFLTLDFILVALVIFSLFLVYMNLLFSFSSTFLFQYASYSSARSYMAGDISEVEQESNADIKFQNLLNQNFFSLLDKNKWIVVSDFRMGYDSTKSQRSNPGAYKPFQGVQISLIYKMLSFELPIAGSTSFSGSPDAFQATVSSFLRREPSQEDCVEFNKKRPDKIYQVLGVSGQVAAPVFFAGENGC